MFQFEKRDDGYLATDASGRGVADVRTVRVVDGKGGSFQRLPLPQAEWVIHFCSRRLTLAELQAFAAAVAQLPAGG